MPKLSQIVLVCLCVICVRWWVIYSTPPPTEVAQHFANTQTHSLALSIGQTQNHIWWLASADGFSLGKHSQTEPISHIPNPTEFTASMIAFHPQKGIECRLRGGWFGRTSKTSKSKDRVSCELAIYNHITWYGGTYDGNAFCQHLIICIICYYDWPYHRVTWEWCVLIIFTVLNSEYMLFCGP